MAHIDQSRVRGEVENVVTLTDEGVIPVWKAMVVCRHATGEGRRVRMGDLSIQQGKSVNHGFVFECPVQEYTDGEMRELVLEALMRSPTLRKQDHEELLDLMVKVLLEIVGDFGLIMCRADTQMYRGHFDVTGPILQLTGRPVVVSTGFSG